MKLNSNIAISESGFIFNPTNGDSFSTNPIGQKIVELLKEKLGKEELLLRLGELYNVEHAVLERDFADFISLLCTYQLMRSHE